MDTVLLVFDENSLTVMIRLCDACMQLKDIWHAHNGVWSGPH